MQKLRPYILSGLFLFHLALLCLIILVCPTNASGPDATALQSLWAVTTIGTLLSQFFLIALWAGLGSDPWGLRLPGCGALATLTGIGLSVVVWRMEGTGPPNDDVIWRAALGPFVAWAVLVGLLLSLRVTPLLKWRIVMKPATPELVPNQALNYSLTRGILIVVTTWGGVLMLSKNSFPWPAQELGQTGQMVTILRVSAIAALLGAIALAAAMLCVGLTLTRLADWMFYRRRWTLPLVVVIALGAAIALLLVRGPPLANPTEILVAIVFLILALAAQPVAALLLMGLAGFRLAPRKQRDERSSDALTPYPRVASASPVGQLPRRLRGAHMAALVTLSALFCTVAPTGRLDDHKIRVFSSEWTSNDAGQITYLHLHPSTTDETLRGMGGFSQLERLNLSGTTITDRGLAHLKGLNELRKLNLPGTQITDAGMAHLKTLPNLQELSLYDTQITDVGLRFLKGMKLVHLIIPGHAKTDTGLMHYLAAIDVKSSNTISATQRLNVESWTMSYDALASAPRGLSASSSAQQFDLASWNITDAGLVHLAGLTNLQFLFLEGTRVTDAGLVHLSELSNLQEIFLSKTKISDAGLVHLTEMSSLQNLGLQRTRITDAGLPHLKKMTHLQELWINNTKITDRGVAELRESLPNCRIFN